MADESDIVKFEDAKRPHDFRRKESKVRAIRKAFEAARKAASGKGRDNGKRGRRKGKGKRK